MSLISDYAEIKNDPKRLEHLESLHAVLTDMMSDSTGSNLGSSSRSTVPNKTELMSIYGRVSVLGIQRERESERKSLEEGSRKRADVSGQKEQLDKKGRGRLKREVRQGEKKLLEFHEEVTSLLCFHPCLTCFALL